MDLHKTINEWVEQNTPVEDPRLVSVMLSKNNILHVFIRCTARDGNYGAGKTVILEYKVEDNKFVVWKKK